MPDTIEPISTEVLPSLSIAISGIIIFFVKTSICGILSHENSTPCGSVFY